MDLKVQHEPMMGEFLHAFREVTETSAFAGGPYVAKFEAEFAGFLGTRHVLGVASGTDALWLSLLALGVGPGDEVITAPNTFMATAEAISLCGAKPVFVDIREDTYTIDPSQLEEAITLRTQAIVPVHIFGQTADMDPILAIARQYGMPVVEDACQAHGAEYKGRMAGSLGVAGCFSFYPGKNLGALGDAGAVSTDEPELWSKVQALRDHGQAAKYQHSTIGWNARMDGIQGAMLSLKLKKLNESNNARRTHARLYSELLAGDARVVVPQVAPNSVHAFHIYAVRVPERDAVRERMAQRGVNCGIHYPVPIHLQKAYNFLGHREGDFPVAEKCAREFLSLPMYPELRPEQIQFVVETLKESLLY
jgi:dTDP-4-amino-4,6-dideoxygalactose transaminase